MFAYGFALQFLMTPGLVVSLLAPTLAEAFPGGEPIPDKAEADFLPPGAARRLGFAGLRHTSTVQAVSISPNGKMLTSAHADESIRIWYLDKTRAPIFLPYGRVSSLGLSADSRHLATATGRQVHLWKLPEGKPVLAMEGLVARVGAVMFSSDGRNLLAGCLDGTVYIWDVKSGNEQKKFRTGNRMFDFVSLSGDANLVVFGSTVGGDLYLVDVPTEKVIFQTQFNFRGSTPVVFSKDSSRIAVVSWDKNKGCHAIPVLDTQIGKVEAQIFTVNPSPVVSFWSDGKTLAITERDNSIHLVEIASGKRISLTAVVARMALARTSDEGESWQDDRPKARWSGGPTS